MMQPCLKQKVVCVITRSDGRVYTAANTCDVGGDICPRIAAGCETGTGYELCGSKHAEANAAELAEESKDVPGEAMLYGHTWMCKDCQDALRAVGVATFRIMPGKAP